MRVRVKVRARARVRVRVRVFEIIDDDEDSAETGDTDVSEGLALGFRVRGRVLRGRVLSRPATYEICPYIYLRIYFHTNICFHTNYRRTRRTPRLGMERFAWVYHNLVMIGVRVYHNFLLSNG